MKTRNGVLNCSFMVVVVFLGAAAVQADTLASIDFTKYATGALIGQDGWTAINGASDLAVTNGVGAANTTGQNAWGSKPLSLGPYSGNTTLVATARFYSIAGNDTVAGLCDANQAGANWLPGVGIANEGGSAKAYFRDVTVDVYGEHYGDVLTVGDTYDMRMNMDLSVAGGRATVSYRDITAGQEAFTQDSKLVNVAMGLSQDGQGKYDFNALALRIAPYGTGISQFTLTSTTVPEPGTMAVMASGVFGLLAYAWRKRK
jgi:hypothetical protein